MVLHGIAWYCMVLHDGDGIKKKSFSGFRPKWTEFFDRNARLELVHRILTADERLQATCHAGAHWGRMPERPVQKSSATRTK
jgi:hypothetical protein